MQERGDSGNEEQDAARTQSRLVQVQNEASVGTGRFACCMFTTTMLGETMANNKTRSLV